MNEDIDEILANILAKEPLTDEEKQHLQIWSNISSKNEKTKKFIQALEQQKRFWINIKSKKPYSLE